MTQSAVNQTRNTYPQLWYRPIFSPEHGVYVVLLVSFLIGAAAAQTWTIATTLALVCAFCGFQAEYPLEMQIKQRRSWKPRFIFWGGFYAIISGVMVALRTAEGIALWLYLSYPILLWIYLAAIAALIIDAVFVFQKARKSVFNELITFAAVCLATPFAYAATTGTISVGVIGLWILNTLFFSSAIFTVKLRKSKPNLMISAVVYHAIAPIIILVFYALHWFSLITALAFSLAFLKLVFIAINLEWYRTTKIQYVALLETGTALAFLAIVALSVLPARLALL